MKSTRRTILHTHTIPSVLVPRLQRHLELITKSPSRPTSSPRPLYEWESNFVKQLTGRYLLLVLKKGGMLVTGVLSGHGWLLQQ